MYVGHLLPPQSNKIDLSLHSRRNLKFIAADKKIISCNISLPQAETCSRVRLHFPRGLLRNCTAPIYDDDDFYIKHTLADDQSTHPLIHSFNT